MMRRSSTVYSVSRSLQPRDFAVSLLTDEDLADLADSALGAAFAGADFTGAAAGRAVTALPFIFTSSAFSQHSFI